MIKYSFLLHHSQKEQLLELLGESAIVDVEVKGWSADVQDKQLLSDIVTITSVVDHLKLLQGDSAKNESASTAYSGVVTSPEQAIELYSSAVAKKEQLLQQLPKLQKEIDELLPWGEFSMSLLTKLQQESGLNLYPYTTSEKNFESNNWCEDDDIVVCSKKENLLYILFLSDDEQQPYLEGATAVKPFTQCYADVQAEYKSVEDAIAVCNGEAAAAAELLPMVQSYLLSLKEELSECKIVKTMQSVADDTLIIVEGWSPKDKCGEVDAIFDANPMVVAIKEEPKEGDNPPILLKNNRFARLCEVVTKLYSLPTYYELDLTPFFAPFFVFFVGICFCDLGYGLITFAGGVYGYFKLKDSSMKDVASLVMWCSFATVVMGWVTGTFFGLSLADYSAFSWFPFLGKMDMFSFALAVGILQILYGMFIKGYFEIKTKGWKYGVSTLSWAFTLIVSGLAYYGADLGMPNFSLSSPIYQSIVGVLVLCYVLFIDPAKKNLLINLGGGSWSLYNALTGILGDTLSYIRLFALGLSGGIIGGVFNDLAVGLSGDVPVLKYVFMILIMLFGHAINIFMSAISSFVHPLRLTFVEFYKCAGFEGGGEQYTPFKKTKN